MKVQAKIHDGLQKIWKTRDKKINEGSKKKHRCNPQNMRGFRILVIKFRSPGVIFVPCFAHDFPFVLAFVRVVKCSLTYRGCWPFKNLRWWLICIYIYIYIWLFEYILAFPNYFIRAFQSPFRKPSWCFWDAAFELPDYRPDYGASH